MTLPTNIADMVTGGAFGIDTVKLTGPDTEVVVTCLMGVQGTDELIVTEKPTGAGYSITDAAVKMPVTRSLDIMFSNPVYSPEVIAAALLSGDLESLTESWTDKKDKLYTIMNTRELVTVQTHIEVIDNCLVKSITPYFSADENWDAFFANIVVHQINPVSTEGGGLLDSILEQF